MSYDKLLLISHESTTLLISINLDMNVFCDCFSEAKVINVDYCCRK